MTNETLPVPNRVNYFAELQKKLVQIADATESVDLGGPDIRRMCLEANTLIGKAKAQAADRKVISLNDEKTKREIEVMRNWSDTQGDAIAIMANGIKALALSMADIFKKSPELERIFTPALLDLERTLMLTSDTLQRSPQPPKEPA